jgi:DMSO reductase family type II enzyme heme b subunit
VKNIAAITALIVMLGLWGERVMAADDMPTKTKPRETPELVQQGKTIYFRRCSFCHGLLGDGNGSAAYQMMPRPRDFTTGLFKFRTTQSGELPTDEDLFRTISRGIPGTAMQTFSSDRIKSGLSEEERWAVIFHIKTFYDGFTDPEADPYKQVMQVSSQIPSSADSIEKGKKIFQEMKCWECHGESGRGNGPNAPRLKDKFRKDPILPFDLTKGWRYKAGNEAQHIYMRFNTGLNGTPMPSFVDSLNDEERWHLANYVVSLQKKVVKSETVLKAMHTKGELPLDPESEAWNGVEGIDVRLAGQVIAHPRWENPSVDVVTMKALYNESEIAFLMEWGDRFEDTVHNQELEYRAPREYNGYVSWEDIPRKPGNFRDSIAIQLPAGMAEGTKKPHFFRGDSGNAVKLWVWKADRQGEAEPSVEEALARGFSQSLKFEEVHEGQAVGKGAWKEGKWRVVMKRALVASGKGDVQFVKGRFIPFSLNVWDGSNGEHGLIMSLSSWHYVYLESSTPAKIYLYAFLGVVFAGLGEFWLVRRVSRDDGKVRDEGGSRPD